MGTYAQQGSFTLNTATGNQSITGLGFTPKLVIFWGHQFATVSSASEVHRFYGAATSSSAQFSTATSVNAYYSSKARQTVVSSLARCIRVIDANNDLTTPIASASFVSMDSNGFTINIVSGAAISVSYLALGGTSLSAKVGYFDIAAQASPYSQSVTGVGFTPKAVMMFNTREAVSANGDNPEGVEGCDGVCIGFASGTSSSEQESVTHLYQSSTPIAKTMNAPGYCVLQMGFFGDGLDARGKISSFDSDGFTLYVDAKWSSSYTRTPYIALGGATTFNVGAVTEPSSTGNQTVSFSNGKLKAAASIFISAGYANTAGSIVSNSRFSFGVAVNSSQRTSSSFSLTETASPTTSNGYGGTNTSAALTTSNFVTPVTYSSVGDVTTQSTGGFTVNWSTVSGSNIRYSYLAIGETTSTSRSMIGIFN